jgi:hypothetical protein
VVLQPRRHLFKPAQPKHAEHSAAVELRPDPLPLDLCWLQLPLEAAHLRQRGVPGLPIPQRTVERRAGTCQPLRHLVGDQEPSTAPSFLRVQILKFGRVLS